MNVLSTFVRSEVYLVLHDEVCLSGAEVEGGLFELLALVAVRQQERGGHQVCPQVVDQELLALGLEGRAVVLVRKEETCGDGLQGQLGCQRLLALLLHRGHLQVQDDWLKAEVSENSRSREFSTRVSIIFSRSTTRNGFLKSRSRLET